jgi:predicted small secreted protein
MKRILMLALLATVSLGALTACQNTWQGAGEDVERMGEKMQDPNQ